MKEKALVLVACLFASYIASFELSASSNLVTVKAGPSPDPRASQYLASIAEPTKFDLKKGDDIEVYVVKLCGSVTTTYIELLRDENPGITFPRVNDDATVKFPACLHIAPTKKVTVTEGESLSTIAQNHMGAAGPRTLSAIVRLNNDRGVCSQIGTRIFGKQLSVCSRVHVGDQIAVPYNTLPVAYKLKPDAAENKVEVVATLNKLIKNDAAGGDDTAGAKDTSEASLVEPIEFHQATPQSGPECKNPNPEAIFNVGELYRILLRNDAIRVATDGDLTPTSATIAVADTGIDSFDSQSFPKRLFDVARENFDGTPGNQSAYGRDIQDPTRAPLAYPDYAYAVHGTHVAGLARGGPKFWNSYFSKEKAPRVKLLIISMVRREIVAGAAPIYSTPSEGISEAAAFASSRHAAVLNISFTAPSLLPTWESTVQRDPHLLVVAAAGNDGEDLDGGVHPFPGSYGGESGLDPLQVITVAAHGSDDNLTQFSDFGSQLVDIAAPGCDVLSDGTQGKTVIYSGTSQAAPIVSFVAGLLSSEGLQTAREIKARIVSSVDLRDSLQDKLAWGGKLNPIKALSVNDDVIELTSDALAKLGPIDQDSVSGSLILGKFVDPDDSPVSCGGEDIPLRSLYKISPQQQERTGTLTARIIRSGPQGRAMASRFCSLKSDGLDIFLLVNGIERPKHVLWKDVVDVVPRWYK